VSTRSAGTPETERAPVDALAGRDCVVHLAGEPIAQRWTQQRKKRIRSSPEMGTTRLIEGLQQSQPRPRVLVTASTVGYYGARGDEHLGEDGPTVTGFLASVCVASEQAAAAAASLGMRTVTLRTGVLLDRADGALARMLPPFRLGLGGPVADGNQYISWIALDDLVRMYLAALDNEHWSGPFNATAPEPVTNQEFAHALGRVLHRPALLAVPAFALRALYGEMASVVTTGQRALPVRALERDFEFRQPQSTERCERLSRTPVALHPESRRGASAAHASARRAASSNGVSWTGSSFRIRSSRATVGLRSPSTSGRATEALTGVTRLSQSEERYGVSTGTSTIVGLRPSRAAIRSIICR